MAVLVTASGPEPGQTLDIPETGMLLGRAEDCTLVLEDLLASSHHARIFRQDRAWRVKDLQSSNGTLVNGRLVGEAFLAEGDVVEIGETRLRFSLVDEHDTGRVSIPRSVSVDMSELEDHPAGQVVRRATEVGTSTDDFALVRAMPARFEAIRRETALASIGRADLLEHLLCSLLAGGHVLVATRPGQGVATLGHALARTLGLQFVPFACAEDLPVDAVPGLLEPGDGAAGDPGTLWMPEELDRASRGFQAALADALREPHGAAAPRRPLPFRWVVATCRPSPNGEEPSGLSDTLADRFMMALSVSDISSLEEEQVLATFAGTLLPEPAKVVDAKPLGKLQNLVRRLPVPEEVVRFASRVVRATRPADALAPEAVRKLVEAGSTLRGGTHLILAAKARALLHGRAQVGIEDVCEVAVPVLRHRLVLLPPGKGARRASRGSILAKAVASVPRRDGP